MTLSLVSAFVFATGTAWAGDDPIKVDRNGSSYVPLSTTDTSGTTDGTGDTGDGGRTTEGDPDDVGGGFGARGDYMFWDAEYEGEELETLERWLLLLMLQVLPTP